METGPIQRRSELYDSLMPREPRWYVAAIYIGQEALAIEHLSRQGFENFIPMRAEDRKDRRGKIIEVRVPRFRGYGFVSLDLNVDQWRSVNGTWGVRHLLPAHLKKPLPLPNGFIEMLMAEPEREEEILAEFLADEMVKILTGALAGWSAKVVVQPAPGEDVQIEFENGVRSWARVDTIERA